MNSLIVFCASYLFIFVILLLMAAILKVANDKKVKFIVAIIITGVVAFILSRIASRLYFDPRPFVTEHVKPLIPHAPDNGFPSDHALLTGALTAIAYFYNRRYANAMLILTFFVGLGRVLAKVHSPLDIGAGWAIGLIGALVGYYLTSWLFNKPATKTFEVKVLALGKATPLLKRFF